MIFLLLMFPICIFASGSKEFFIGELKSQVGLEEASDHFGFLFLKRELIPEEERIIDRFLLTTKDGEVLELGQNSSLRKDLHETILSDEQGIISGSGELVGFPWHWTALKEKLFLDIDGLVEVDVENQFEKNTMHSKAVVFTLESDGSRLYFGTFYARLYKIDVHLMEKFFQDS